MNYNNRTFYSINTNETLVTILHANVYSLHRYANNSILHRLRAYETNNFLHKTTLCNFLNARTIHNTMQILLSRYILFFGFTQFTV